MSIDIVLLIIDTILILLILFGIHKVWGLFLGA